MSNNIATDQINTSKSQKEKSIDLEKASDKIQEENSAYRNME